MMTKKLISIGNSQGIILDKSILEFMNIDRDTELQVKTDDGNRIIIEPVDQHRKRVMTAAKTIAETHASTFEKLAK